MLAAYKCFFTCIQHDLGPVQALHRAATPGQVHRHAVQLVRASESSSPTRRDRLDGLVRGTQHALQRALRHAASVRAIRALPRRNHVMNIDHNLFIGYKNILTIKNYF